MSVLEPSAGIGGRPRLRPLTLVEDGDDVLVGDPATGTFVAVPAIGATVIRALQQGATIEETAAEAERRAGEPVDVASFVEALRELGFVERFEPDARAPRSTAPIQQRRWRGGPLRRAWALWQCMVFLRTDLYGVLVTATGCRNLWEVKSLLLRQAFGRLTPQQAGELAAADPRDLRVGLWFRWVYLAGFIAALAYFAYFVLPVLTSLLAWSTHGLATGPAHPSFWLSAAGSVLLYVPPLGVLAVWLAGRRQPTAERA